MSLFKKDKTPKFEKVKEKSKPKKNVEVKDQVKKKVERVDFEKLNIRALRKLAKNNGVRRWNTRTRRGLYTALRAKGL